MKKLKLFIHSSYESLYKNVCNCTICMSGLPMITLLVFIAPMVSLVAVSTLVPNLNVWQLKGLLVSVIFAVIFKFSPVCLIWVVFWLSLFTIKEHSVDELSSCWLVTGKRCAEFYESNNNSCISWHTIDSDGLSG